MPDIFVPADTLEMTNYFMMVKNRGILYRFALDYTDQNRSVLLKHSENLHELINYLDSQNLLSQFVTYAEQKKIEPNKNEIKISERLLIINIKAEIAQKIFDTYGYYPIIKEVDFTLQRAIKELSK